MKRQVPDKPLGEPVRKFEDTFSVFDLACDNCHGFGDDCGFPCQTCGGTGWKPESNRTETA